MTVRLRLLGGVAVVALLICDPALAATAAPAPSMAVIPNCGPAKPGPTGTVLTYSIRVIGQNLGIYGVYIVFNPPSKPGTLPTPAPPQVQPFNQAVDQVINPPLMPPGTYQVQIQDLDYYPLASAEFTVPCPPSPSPSPAPLPSPGVLPRVLNPTLTLTPAVGPPGTVTVAHGTDFPASTPIQLGWSVGIAGTTHSAITSDGSGAFTATVLILPHDELGNRVLTAVSVQPPNSTSFGFASANFLVVPGEVQPRDFSWRR
jgi:hypothetical protein